MLSKYRILLLNPPGKLTYSRDYFCSKVTKTGYIEHPVDLLILSGILSEKYEISFVDAIIENLSEKKIADKIINGKFDYVIFLTGSSSFCDDSVFFRGIKSLVPGIKLIGIGDILRDSEIFLNSSWIDAVILDFTNTDIISFIEKKYESISSMYYRANKEVFLKKNVLSGNKALRVFEIPVPKHEIFLNDRYLFPFSRHPRYATVLTDFGCPFNCSFCLYCTLGFKLRSLENVAEELKYLKKLGITEIFFKDQAFGAVKSRTLDLCSIMQAIGEFSWSCFMRADSADSEILAAMKRSGCHTIMFGVESADQIILNRYNKALKAGVVQNAFELCRNEGIETLGIFMLGFPEESDASCRKTSEMPFELKCDYISLNIFVPKYETPARKWLGNKISDFDWKTGNLDQSGVLPFKSYAAIPTARIKRIKDHALIKFYLRPNYILRRLRKVKSLFELKMLFRMGFSLFSPLLESLFSWLK
ncbi:MAG: radical SAM protein [Candidatus Riflebacteria bacterium]|nr:radical SAM protein [Candidatus Riflebacteria bacterium]